MTSELQNPEASPAELLARIQARFRELGLWEKTVTLSHRGQKYLARCDAHSFSVYRRIENCHVPPGAPGWPVCLVTPEAVLDEGSPPPLPADDFASGLGLQDWLRLIEAAAPG